MKPAAFDYIAPHSLAEVLSSLHSYGYDAKPLAGGQSLVPVMNFRLAQPGVLIDLNGVAGLDHLHQTADATILFGCMVRQSRLERDPLVAAQLPLLHEVMPHIAHAQIRNRGTFGGSLAHADPAAELPVITVALNGRLHLQSTTSDRWVSAADFFTGLFTTDCAPEELLTEIAIPALPPHTGAAFAEVARRHGDYALSGVTAVITTNAQGVCTAARLVYLNAGEQPIVATHAAQLLLGNPYSTELATAVAHTAQQEIDPTSDIHATADFKRHLATVLTQQTIQQAFARAAT